LFPYASRDSGMQVSSEQPSLLSRGNLVVEEDPNQVSVIGSGIGAVTSGA
jgi:hypothetical protein